MDSEKTTPTKTVSNGKWFVEGMLGRDCCRSPYEPCHASCKVMWKLWIVILAVFLLVSALTNIGIGFWRFERYDGHEDVFVALKMKRMLILGPRLIPGIYGILNFGAIFVALWAFTLSFVPCFVRSAIFGTFRFVCCLLRIALILLLVVEVVYGWGDWPDDIYATSLERRMTADLRVQDVDKDNISSTWTDTQQAFDCCGVNSYQDWFNIGKNQTYVKGMRTLPYSCCKESSSDADFCYEALSASWNERGCLQPQIHELKVDWIFLTVSTLLLFISVDATARAVLIFIIKFPPGSCKARTKNDLTPSSSWERHPPPPRKTRHGKKHKYKTVPQMSEDDDQKPLLTTSHPATAHRRGGLSIVVSPNVAQTQSNPETAAEKSRSYPETSEALFLYRSPTQAIGAESAHSLQELSRTPSSELPKPLAPPPAASNPPQIYFPSRAPSSESSSGSSDISASKQQNPPIPAKKVYGLAKATVDETERRLAERETAQRLAESEETERRLAEEEELKRSIESHVTQIFLGQQKQNEGFHTPQHGSSVPLLLQDKPN